MMLDGWKCFLSKLLYVWIVASRRVFLKDVHRLLMGIDLLPGVGFVEALGGCTIKIVDQFLMLGIQLGRKLHLDIFCFYDARKLLGSFGVSIDHLLPKLLYSV